MDRRARVFVLMLSVSACAPAPMGADAGTSPDVGSDALDIDASEARDVGAPDAAVSDAFASGSGVYDLNDEVTTATTVACGSVGEGFFVTGRAGETRFQFAFRGAPADGDYVVEPASALDVAPATATGVVVGYERTPSSAELHVAQIGSVTVRMEATLHVATTTRLTSAETTSGAAGTIAGDLHCP